MPLFAIWSFASPWLLLWGVTAALPVLIHLWSRRRFVETTWAATQFLLAAIRRHQRRIQIEQWLLLAIRAAILLLLAIAFAEPIVSGLPGIGGWRPQPPTHTILVIDTSYSMAYEASETTRLSDARLQATKLVEYAAPGDAFSLVTLADPPEVIIREPSANHSAVIAEINGLRITNRRASLTATLSQIEQLLSAVEDRFEHQHVHIFSDLSKSTWDDSPTDNWRSRLAALSPRAALHLGDTSANITPDNTAIARIALQSGTVVVGAPVLVDVELASFAKNKQLRKRVELSVDGTSAGEQFVDLESGARATANFAVTFNVAGEHVLKATIGDDGLKVDNDRWLSVPVRDTTRVLCIQGRPHAAEYVAFALSPSADTNGIHPEVASEHAIIERTLHDYDCIFLCNVAHFTPDEAQKLLDYVEQGGGLVFVLGDLVNSEGYNEQLGAESLTKLLPASLNETVGDGRHGFNPLEYRHPLTLPFRGHERSGLLTVPIWRYIRLDRINENASVALAFENGDPAIVEEAVGQGRVLLVATAASPESVDRTTEPATPWTALASWPSFPPLIHEIVRLAASNRVAQRNMFVGDLLSSRLQERSASSTATLLTPDNNELPLHINDEEDSWTYDQANQPGVYRLRFDDENIPQQTFSVNLEAITSDASESNLESVLRDELSELFDDAQLNAPPQSFAEQDVPLFRIALGTLLALLVAETFLAARFGRAST
ncbi:MAG: VWA domain-containing protein [Planctomycetes bacterium]|nr:VWA domain-containing protein [Planctomycetota bacterium]